MQKLLIAMTLANFAMFGAAAYWEFSDKTPEQPLEDLEFNAQVWSMTTYEVSETPEDFSTQHIDSRRVMCEP